MTITPIFPLFPAPCGAANEALMLSTAQKGRDRDECSVPNLGNVLSRAGIGSALGRHRHRHKQDRHGRDVVSVECVESKLNQAPSSCSRPEIPRESARGQYGVKINKGCAWPYRVSQTVTEHQVVRD